MKDRGFGATITGFVCRRRARMAYSAYSTRNAGGHGLRICQSIAASAPISSGNTTNVPIAGAARGCRRANVRTPAARSFSTSVN